MALAFGSDNADCAHPPSANTHAVNGYRASWLAGTAMHASSLLCPLPARNPATIRPYSPTPLLPYHHHHHHFTLLPPSSAAAPPFDLCPLLPGLCELPPSARPSRCRDTCTPALRRARAFPRRISLIRPARPPPTASHLPLCAAAILSRCFSFLPRLTPNPSHVDIAPLSSSSLPHSRRPSLLILNTALLRSTQRGPLPAPWLHSTPPTPLLRQLL
jgi:hypothetical protein